MKTLKILLCSVLVVVLAVSITKCNPIEDVTHDQAVEEAINTATDHDDDTPQLADSENEPEDVPEIAEDIDDTDIVPPPDQDAIAEEEPQDEVEEPVVEGEEGTEEEVISLPHLPDPKYDDDGDVLWFPRIIGGSRAQQGEFPSKVSIQNRGGSHFCGGNLISNNHILTAAHCVVTEEGHLLNPTSMEIMAGDISITRNAGPYRVFRVVSHIFVHTGYDPHTMANDVAVLRVSVPFHEVEGILTYEHMAVGLPVTGTVCHLAGWGATSEGSNSASPNLMRVNLEIVDTARCNKSYQGMIGENMFCAGTMSGGRDACQGDSGGGLMCDGLITGIVSFGFGCGRPRFPGVYMDVSAYGEFIENAVHFEGAHEDIPRPELRPSGSTCVYQNSIVLLVISLAVYHLRCLF